MSFSQRLRELRKEHGLTQHQLSEIAGICQSNINTWETGRSLPLPNGLISLANAFECSIDYLLGREQEDGSIIIKYSPEIRNSIIPNELENIYTKLNSRNRVLLVEIANVIARSQQRTE